MNHFRLIGCLLFALALLPGCLDITEELYLNKNGSGKYELRVDPGRFIDAVSNLVGEDSLPASSLVPMLDSTIRAKIASLQGLPGLSEVKLKQEGTAYAISYKFESIAALNAATSNQNEGEEGLFSFQERERIFSRQGIVTASDTEESEDYNPLVSNMVLAEGTYTAVYHLPGKVLTQENAQAFFRDNQRTVVLKVSLMEVVTGEVSVGNVITYRRR